MAGYGALKRQMLGQNLSKRLRKIVIHMPSAETGGKHVMEHHWAGERMPDKYEFERAEGPEVARLISRALENDEAPGDQPDALPSMGRRERD
jgi:hypothetical protein